MKILITLIASLLMAVSSYPQEGGVIAKEFINFFINSENANTKTEIGRNALISLGNIMGSFGNMKHDRNVSQLSRSQVQMNVSNGSLVSFSYDDEGNFYLKYGGEKYVLAPSLIKQAKETFFMEEVQLGVLPPYDWKILEKDFYCNKEGSFFEYKLRNKKETLQEVARRNNVDIKDVYVLYLEKNKWKGTVSPSGKYKKAINFRTLHEGEPFVKGFAGYAEIKGYTGKGYVASIWIDYKKYPNKVNYLLTCKWAMDQDGNGELKLEEFNGLRRGFHEDEAFEIYFVYQTEEESTISYLEIYDNNTGKMVMQKYFNSKYKANRVKESIRSYKFPPGVYLMNFKVKNSRGRVILNKLERFEIVKRK